MEALKLVDYYYLIVPYFFWGGVSCFLMVIFAVYLPDVGFSLSVWLNRHATTMLYLINLDFLFFPIIMVFVVLAFNVAYIV